jgi:hypothetical protein
MKVIFETEEQYEIDALVNALKYKSFLFDLYHNFWRKWKHQPEEFTLDSFREELNLLFEENTINVNNLG